MMTNLPPLRAAAVFSDGETARIVSLNEVLNRIDELVDWMDKIQAIPPAVLTSRLNFLVTPLERIARIVQQWEKDQREREAIGQSMPTSAAPGAEEANLHRGAHGYRAANPNRVAV